MIVKVKSEKDCWSYFEGDNIVQHTVDTSNTNVNSYPDTLMFLRSDTKINMKVKKCKCGEYHTKGIRLCVQKENKVIARILTNKATYLMNDLGKTVDKLF